MKDSSMPDVAGLYIHIPFCRIRCGYCNFYSVTSLFRIPDFLAALIKEMDMYSRKFSIFDTVYIGGGTPSLLGIQQLRDVLQKIEKSFVLPANTEITIEANPADLDISFLKALRDMGVNRLSIGIQSFDRQTLEFLERRHTADQAIYAIETARSAGFDNIGLDLIYGVPGQDMASWLDTLSRAVSFHPEHLSCYQLTLDADTPLGIRRQKGDFSLPGDDLQYDFFMKTAGILKDAGYIHYEVSNFSRDMRFFSRHNQKYWNHTPYLGLGPGAHSFVKDQRWWNHRSLEKYIADVEAGKPPVQEMESLTMEQLQLEALCLGLRTKRGINISKFAGQYNCDLIAQKKKVLKRLQEEGLIAIQDGSLRPTLSGLAVADSLSLI